MEALHNLKVESLQADNRRLEAQVANYVKAITELEAERAKMKMLKKKLRSEAKQNKEQILALQQKVRNLAASDLDKQLKMQTLRLLEEEVEELRKSNQNLKIENSDLAQRLESTQILAISVLEDHEAEALKEESRRLKQENENLEKVIEQLQADRCTDVEELVYLRWINACLRYELRDYQRGTGKTIARDLSKTLSPESEKKAKQPILEYADREGLGEKGINFVEFDSDEWSSSQSSYHTDSGEFDDSPVDNTPSNKTNTSTKMKIFRKLRRLLRGQGSRHHSESPPLKRTPSMGDMVETPRDAASCNSTPSARHCAGIDGCGNRLRTSSHSSENSVTPEKSLDLIRLKSVKIEDTQNLEGFCRKRGTESSAVYKRSLDREGVTDSSVENQPHKKDLESKQRSELLKYAEALKGSHGIPPKIPRKSMSYGSL